MKKLIINTLFCFYLSTSIAQTILWKQVASLPEGYCSGEAVSLNNEIYFVTGRNDSSTSSFFYQFNPKTDQWKKLADIPEPVTNLAFAEVNGKYYAIGSDLFKNTNREYNPQSNSWKILEPMPTIRQHISSGVSENEIYICGGLSSWKYISKKMK